MEAPQSFKDMLNREFPGYRIRWSVKDHTWQIEQKVQTGEAFPPYYISEGDDTMIRARDGYVLVMTVSPGTRTKCPDCYLPFDIPALKSVEVRCDYCHNVKGRDGRHLVGYFPLTETLIQHLRKGDPTKGRQFELSKEIDLKNQRRLDSAKRAASSALEGSLRDDFKQIAEIEGVGYTGKEDMWIGKA